MIAPAKAIIEELKLFIMELLEAVFMTQKRPRVNLWVLQNDLAWTGSSDQIAPKKGQLQNELKSTSTSPASKLRADSFL